MMTRLDARNAFDKVWRWVAKLDAYSFSKHFTKLIHSYSLHMYSRWNCKATMSTPRDIIAEYPRVAAWASRSTPICHPNVNNTPNSPKYTRRFTPMIQPYILDQSVRKLPTNTHKCKYTELYWNRCMFVVSANKIKTITFARKFTQTRAYF